MSYDNPIATLHLALGAAIHRDLPDCEDISRDWNAWNKLTTEERNLLMKENKIPLITSMRRPREHEVEVYLFNQTWGSTALGYDGVGGQALTSAYTVVVEFHGVFCVYFGGDRLAYKVDLNDLASVSYKHFAIDLDARNMPDVMRAAERYMKK